MSRSKQILVLLICLVSITLAGCRDEQFKGDENGNTIRFKCDSIATRALGYETGGTNPILSMGVYAAATPGNWDGSVSCDFMQDVNVTRIDGTSPWKYDNEKLWPGSGKISFFAYAPIGTPSFNITSRVGAPAFDLAIQNEQKDQVDFLIATPQKNQTKSSSVDGYTTMTLRHALSRVFFAAKIKDEVDEKVVVTNVEITGVKNAGSTTMDGTNRVWIPKATTANYTLTAANGGLKSNLGLTHTEYQTITPEDGSLFLLPQTLPTDAMIKVTYTLNNVAEPVVEFPLSDILAQWQAGESIRFLINIDANTPFNIEFSYTFTAWKEALTTDVPVSEDPYLYVSDLKVSAYDGATTRVYFYTNQATPYIDPQARLSTADGVATKTKHHFYNLVNDPNATDPNEKDYGGALNFKYSATSKKGYFDVVNRIFKDSPTGDKTPVVIRLRAGKLDKYITIIPHVTPFIAASTTGLNSPTDIRYLSVFHRRAEKGERVLSWYEPESLTWSVSVDKTMGDYQDLIIDRLPSVDHHTHLLYTASPRDPEGGTVDEGWGSTLTGRGRVHFRVGWKTTSPDKNRYDRINYTYTPDGQGENTIVIRCRQGEEPDFIANDTQEQFAVYNLMGDGEFAQYPSQGGFISQWGRPRMWPLVGNEAPAGYPSTETSTELDPDVAICPEGYGYPTKAIIGSYFQNVWGVTALTTALNSLCADGFYDRRTTENYRVDPSSIHIAARGVVVFSNDLGSTNCKSMFLPSPGYRNETGLLAGIGARVTGTMRGTLGGYWSGEEMIDKRRAYGFHADAAGTVFTDTRGIIGPSPGPFDGYDKRTSFMVRCVKVKNAIKLIFDANGGENAPRAATSAPNGTVYVTRRIPINYWRPGYFFVGWDTNKNSATASVYPSGNYPMQASNVTLYAIWSQFFKVNLNHTMLDTHQAIYLTTGSYTGYAIGNNGVHISATDAEAIDLVAAKEKAHYHLEFDNVINGPDTWENAYAACKNKGGTWRLPRMMELLIFSQRTVIPAWAQSDLFGGVSTPLWCGTEQDNDKAYEVMYYNSRAIGKAKTAQEKYRCVREVAP